MKIVIKRHLFVPIRPVDVGVNIESAISLLLIPLQRKLKAKLFPLMICKLNLMVIYKKLLISFRRFRIITQVRSERSQNMQDQHLFNKTFNSSKITGKKVSIICSNLRINNQNLKTFQIAKNQIFTQFQGFLQNLKQIQSQIVQSLYFLSQSRNYKAASLKNIQTATTLPSKLSNFDSQLIIMDNRSNMNTNTKADAKLFENSNIIKNQPQIDILLQFFNRKKIKSTKILYKATQNGFSTKRFHIECDQVPNTLLLCQTIDGKIIGGYTPLLWQIVKGQMSQQRDNSLNTFIFSLTENIKFTSIKLRQNSSLFNNMTSGTSITKSSSQIGPCFGKFEFVIKDEANLQGQNAWIRYQQNSPSFNYGQFYHNSKQYYKKMIGNELNGKFRVKQWQVLRIKFKNQNSNIKFQF